MTQIVCILRWHRGGLNDGLLLGWNLACFRDLKCNVSGRDRLTKFSAIGEHHARIIEAGCGFIRVTLRLVSEAAEVDELELVIVRIVEYLQVCAVRLADSTGSLVGLLHSKLLVARELDCLVFLRVIDDHEDALVAQSGKLDSLLQKAAAALAKGHIPLSLVLDLLRFIDFTFCHSRVG